MHILILLFKIMLHNTLSHTHPYLTLGGRHEAAFWSVNFSPAKRPEPCQERVLTSAQIHLRAYLPMHPPFPTQEIATAPLSHPLLKTRRGQCDVHQLGPMAHVGAYLYSRCLCMQAFPWCLLDNLPLTVGGDCLASKSRLFNLPVRCMRAVSR